MSEGVNYSRAAASGSVDDRRLIQTRWVRMLQDAVDADEWGQSLEAIEGYDRLSQQMASSGVMVSSAPDVIAQISKVRHCLKLRAESLRSHQSSASVIRLQDVKALVDTVKGFFSTEGRVAKFPLDMSKFPANQEAAPKAAPVDQSEKLSQLNAAKQKRIHGTQVAITVKKIGLKDSDNYVDPIITITVVDAFGNALEQPQDTKVSTCREHFHIVFDYEVHLNTRLEQFKPGCAIFFEFKHKKTDKISTRCFSFMEFDEMLPGVDIPLELYKKPTDFTRKRLKLHTIKPLFTTISLTFSKNE